MDPKKPLKLQPGEQALDLDDQAGPYCIIPRKEATMEKTYLVTPGMRRALANRFSYHPPVSDQVERYGAIRSQALTFALLLSELCPESRELSLALTHLDECVMNANAAIARNEALPATAEPREIKNHE